MYHRNIKGRRGVTAERQVLCYILDGAQLRIASLMDFSTPIDCERRLPARPPLYRWAINHRENLASWSTDSLSSWM
jgi:hypothetical protein